MSIKSFILNNIGLKLLALVTAIVLWLYVAGEQGNTTIKEIIGHKTEKESDQQK